MPDDRQIWTDFLNWCLRERDEMRAQLVPLQTGEMRLGKRGADTDGQWKDVTDDEIALLKRGIASLEGVIANLRDRLSHA